MKLITLKLKNYRCFKDEIIFKVDDLTAIIGKNDIGKSTILDGLNAFFNDLIDDGDLSTNANNNTVEISCIFEDVPDPIILDTSEPTSAREECILNIAGELEIRKTFSFGARTTKAIYLMANHPIDDRIKDILSLKNTALKNLADELNIDLSEVNRRKNPSIRRAIREAINSPLGMMELKVDGNVDNESNLKTIWGSLSKNLPVFSLFKVDKSPDDKDEDVQDPMKEAVKLSLALPEIQKLLERIETKVKEKSTEVASQTIEKMKSFDESLAERLKSDFSKNRTWDKIFDLKLLNENNIPLNKRGSGIRRLVLLSFFQAQAEKKRSEKEAPSIIYAIEEPETSQHPNHQKLLINSLVRLSEQDNVQVLFTTHSANLVREIPIKSLRYISKPDNGGLNIEYGFNLTDNQENEEVIEKIIETLGILPNPQDTIKVLLFIEGNNDVNALLRYSQTLHEHDTEILDLNDTKAVGYIIAGGDSLKYYIERKYLSGLGKPEVHIYDSDKDEYRTIISNINAENNPNKVGFNTSKPEIENFLIKDAIIEAYTDNGITDLQLDDFEKDSDVPLEVAKAIYNHTTGLEWDELDDDKQKKKISSVKKILNTQAVEKMNIDRINQVGFYKEIKSWLDTIASFIRN